MKKGNNMYEIRSLCYPIIKFHKKKSKKIFPLFLFFDVPKQNGAILGHKKEKNINNVCNLSIKLH